jgi:hypothetical protein
MAGFQCEGQFAARFWQPKDGATALRTKRRGGRKFIRVSVYGFVGAVCARLIAAMTRRGVIGVSLISAPRAARASRTALAIAAGGATAPPSPIPFMPYSVCGVGVCRWPILIAGISAAPGSR